MCAKALRKKGYSDGDERGCKDIMLSVKTFSKASDVEAVLREKNLVHADECLHIQAEILSMK